MKKIWLIITLVLALPIMSSYADYGEKFLMQCNSLCDQHVLIIEENPVPIVFINGSLIIRNEEGYDTFSVWNDEDSQINIHPETSFNDDVYINDNKKLYFGDSSQHIFATFNPPALKTGFLQEGIYTISTVEPVFSEIVEDIAIFTEDSVTIRKPVYVDSIIMHSPDGREWDCTINNQGEFSCETV